MKVEALVNKRENQNFQLPFTFYNHDKKSGKLKQVRNPSGGGSRQFISLRNNKVKEI